MVIVQLSTGSVKLSALKLYCTVLDSALLNNLENERSKTNSRDSRKNILFNTAHCLANNVCTVTK